MTIQRRYEPDPEAFARVVEILYQLLVEPQDGVTESSASAPSDSPASICAPMKAEA
jgi:hypothetical protein